MSFESNVNNNENIDVEEEIAEPKAETPTDAKAEAEAVQEKEAADKINEELLLIDTNLKEIAGASEDKIKKALLSPSFVNKLKEIGEIASSLGLMVAGFATIVSSSASEIRPDSIVPAIGAACMMAGALVGTYLTNRENNKKKTVLAK